jgi:hypothetical protein
VSTGIVYRIEIRGSVTCDGCKTTECLLARMVDAEHLEDPRISERRAIVEKELSGESSRKGWKSFRDKLLCHSCKGVVKNLGLENKPDESA